MVIAATLVMIVGMIFRIPYSWQGAIYALLVSRESPRATLQSSGTIFLVAALGVAYVRVLGLFVISFPVLHFLGTIVPFFLRFDASRTLTQCLEAVACLTLM